MFIVLKFFKKILVRKTRPFHSLVIRIPAHSHRLGVPKVWQNQTFTWRCAVDVKKSLRAGKGKE